MSERSARGLPPRVTVFGLGTFGGQIAVARFFARQGSRVTVTDKKTHAQLETSVRELDGLPVRFVLGHHDDRDVIDTDLVVRSPAVPPSHELLERARAAGVPVTTEILLTLERLRAPYVAVTGTKGKSTTTALLGAMLEAHHGRVRVGGNIGRPLLEEADAIDPREPVVLELSSFMAEDMSLARAAGASVPAPRVLVITNLAPEHLDRHGSKDAYYAAKLSLLDGMSADDTLVHLGRGELAELVARRAAASASGARSPAAGASLSPGRGFPRALAVDLAPDSGASSGSRSAKAGTSVLAREGDRVVDGRSGDLLFLASELSIPGEHNVENAALAALAAREMGVPVEAIRRAIRAFRSLPHRLETVAEDSLGRTFVNDSIATTPEAALAALASFEGRAVVLLLGGSEKGSDYRALAREAARRAHAVVCLGKTGPAIAELTSAAFAEPGGPGVRVLSPDTPRVVLAPGFDDAFTLGRELCPPGGVVLLSPACASYDMFRNFEERGERFGALARAAVAAPTGRRPR